jgi:hypothetical protein
MVKKAVPSIARPLRTTPPADRGRSYCLFCAKIVTINLHTTGKTLGQTGSLLNMYEGTGTAGDDAQR